MNRRTKGDGTIREYKSGKWMARITINGKQIAFYGSSEKEVTKKLKEYKKKIGLGLTDHKKMTYSDFLDTWLEKKKSVIKPQTYYRYETVIENDIKTNIGFLHLDKIEPDIIQSEVIDKKVKTAALTTVQQLYYIMKRTFTQAIKEGKIIRNPMDLVVIPNETRRDYVKKQNEIFTNDEIVRFVNEAGRLCKNGKPAYLNGQMFILMLNTGLRVGEACALVWEDYDEENSLITVNSTVARVKDTDGKRLVIRQQSPKTKRSNRTLKLNSKAVAAIPKERIGEYIYCTRSGTILDYENVQKTLNIILEKANIDRKTTHVFRHTFASKLFEKGIDPKIVSELLGHYNVSITYDIYIHLIQSQKAKAMDAIDDMY